MNTRSRGAYSELIAAADMLRLGYEVFRAVSQHSNPDLVAILDGQTYKVEVRTALPPVNGVPRTGLAACRVGSRDDCDLYALVQYNGSVDYYTSEEAHAYRASRGLQPFADKPA